MMTGFRQSGRGNATHHCRHPFSMFERLPALFRSALYALRGGFLIRPLAIALALGAAGAVLSSIEELFTVVGRWIPTVLFPSQQDPGVAQIILSSIATSIMTVVSIVFAILLMTLTLASTQFSPRILIGFVRDRTTQWTLGVFLGTFSYCMAALPAARTLPHPFVPAATVSGAMLLALGCVAWLIYFIYHVSQSISVNHIVDRIAHETELVIAEHMPYPRSPFHLDEPEDAPSSEPVAAVLSRKSGYIRYVDINRLTTLAREYSISVCLERRVGHFVPAGVPIIRVSKPELMAPEIEAHLLAAFDIGPTRTMQQDVEFGIIQIVDIALRAISPAVNDPSTAISCIDQLSRIIVYWLGREPAKWRYYAPPHVLRVVLPWITFQGLIDTAFDQIRHYSVADVAVSLRLIRAFQDIATAARREDEKSLLMEVARRVMAGNEKHLSESEFARVKQRIADLQAFVAAGGQT